MSEASEELLGAIASGEIKTVSADAPVEGWTGEQDIPSDFDSATNWPKCASMINDIRDQSNCGCCWAFGTAEAASDRMCIATDGATMLPLSAQELCFCSSFDGCGGGFPLSAWQWIGKNGLVTGGQISDGPFDHLGLCSDFTLPHCHHHGPQGKDPYPAEGQPGCASQSSPSCPKQCGANAKAPHNEFANDKCVRVARAEATLASARPCSARPLLPPPSLPLPLLPNALPPLSTRRARLQVHLHRRVCAVRVQRDPPPDGDHDPWPGDGCLHRLL